MYAALITQKEKRAKAERETEDRREEAT